jgi:glucan phosphoethanolaminetransferase (alkaline phosphatase superfamily)
MSMGKVPRLIVLLKIAASGTLVAATVGMLWHEKPALDLWGHDRPAWFLTIAYGWYPAVADYTRWLSNSGFAPALIYLFVSVSCVFALLAAPFIVNRVLRVVTSAILIVGTAYDLTMYDIGGGLPSSEITETVLSSIVFGLGGTVQLYAVEIGRNTALAAMTFVIFCLRPPKIRHPQFAWAPMAVVVMATVGVTGIIWRTGGHTNEFPPPFTSYYHALNFLTAAGHQPIAKTNYPGVVSRSLTQIILIVDESVRADYLSLNNPSIDTTPFLVARRRDIANFGVGVAPANCSREARQALRFGLRDGDLGQAANALGRLAPFWEYARQAQLETVHIGTMITPAKPMNELVHGEGELVDRRIMIEDKPQYIRDEVIADRLRTLMFEPGPKFVFVEKFGIHVPYDKMYPPGQNIFDADTAMAFDLSDRANLIKHYENAIRWSVNRFFSAVLKDGLPPNTLMIYTSDHGQSLSEGRITSHCNKGVQATRGEAEVPLFALSSSDEWTTQLSRSAALNFDRASDLEIFPTLLAAMGYDRRWISEQFGLTLLDKIPTDRKRRFWATGSMRVYDSD